ncbi:hypothetical protein VNO78_33111 [Psophocarpus tetragonolobus]|uniref:PORR domain-containing protein n=1 Tax=Psophocarpus tetragonolobus TaxID=3891 RepID=A0AAN9NWR9_PSOTE
MPQPRPTRLLSRRTIFDGAIKQVRDRGLDHAVEREKHLKPLLCLKNLINGEPSKSLPVSLIKRSLPLPLPFRPIEFLRKYPSVFEEFLPTAAAVAAPHFRLTPKTLRLDADEQLLHHSDRFKQQAAEKLSKLLMLSRIHKIPLSIIKLLLWDVGLPDDYAQTVVPEFPDCFRIADGFLELVCWSHELAVPALQHRSRKNREDEFDGEVVFPVQFSNGFEIDKKYEKWLREWQRLPYVSPYENFSHLGSTSDESDRWVVGVLHEILHVFVGKKVEKDILLEFGECLGLRSRFKRALLQHPGIFYVSSKNGTYTVVLREGYKRGALVEDHPVMNLRTQYVHLMNSVREEGKIGKVVQVDEVEAKGVEGVEGEGDGVSVEEGEDEEEACEVEDASETDVDDDEEGARRGSHRVATGRRVRDYGKEKLDVVKSGRDSWRERSPLRGSRRERSPLRDSRNERSVGRTTEKNSFEFSKRRQVRGDHKDVEYTQERSRGRDYGKEKLDVDKFKRDSGRERSPLRGSHRGRSPLRDFQNERSVRGTREKNSFEFSHRRQLRGAHKDVEYAQERSRSSKRNCRDKKAHIHGLLRLKIAIDVARSLNYLYPRCTSCENLKAANMLLDSDDLNLTQVDSNEQILDGDNSRGTPKCDVMEPLEWRVAATLCSTAIVLLSHIIKYCVDITCSNKRHYTWV